MLNILGASPAGRKRSGRLLCRTGGRELRLRHLGLGGLLLGISLSAAGPVHAEGRTLVVAGEGVVAASPDTAWIDAGVTTQGATAADAMQANAVAMKQVLAALAELQIPDHDVQTRRLQLFPIYSKRTGAEAPRITGYRASNQVQVRVRDLSAVGSVLDRVSAAGANEIGNLRFEVADPAALLDRARSAAVADAQRKARLLAQEAGVALGELRELREGGTQAPPPMPMARMEQAASVPIATGELEFRASVQLVYELKTR